MRESPEFEPIFLAKSGPPLSTLGQPHSGTPFAPVDGDDHQYLFFTDGYKFDWLFGTMNDKEFYTKHFHAFLEAFRPDVVHFQHTLHLGYELIRQVRNTLPNTPIVYTLHELLPICHRQGQMVRTINDEELCHTATPRRCHECFPHISPQSFFMRKRFIQAHLARVDLFLAPSRFLLQRYLDWGIPPTKIRFEEYGRLPVKRISDVEAEGAADRPRTRFAFFGQLTQFKGVQVLLEAVDILAKEWTRPVLASSTRAVTTSGAVDAGVGLEDPGERPPASVPSPAGNAVAPHFWLHGSNLDLQPGTFQNQFNALLDATEPYVTLSGRYDHTELPHLMANVDWVIVPSIWWENSPLVIQEAFLHGRPVICSDIGGMAEKVIDGVNGLHFHVGDPDSLARTIDRAVRTPGLWQTLRKGIPEIYRMDDHIATLSNLYRTLLAQKQAGEGRIDDA